MALDLCQNLISSQYLKNEWMEYNKNLAYALILVRYWLRLLFVKFLKYITRVMALNSSQNFVFAQCLKNESTKLNKILHTLWY